MFQLAEIIGCSIRELDERLTYEEYACWQFYLAEPSGDRRADYHTAMIVKAVYDFMLGFSKSKKKIRLTDTLLKFEARESKVSSVARKASVLFGGIIPKELIEKAEQADKEAG